MQNVLPEKLKILAKTLAAPLYVVGGFTRDFLSTPSAVNPDIDLCSPTLYEEFCSAAKSCGFQILSVYKTTGTVKLRDGDGREYEYACFRSDEYVRGTHRPVQSYFTTDIHLDAKRRDFTCNAVYYDIKRGEFVDPLGGIPAIRERRLTTVDRPEKVFGEDGLRLMRLARQAAQLNFEPDASCLNAAKKNADLLKDVSPERIFCELQQLLYSDEKYGYENGPKHGLEILDKTGVLDVLFPELALGRNLSQRADFHRYDVLAHTIAAVAYADKSVRLAALFHDVGKPFCFHRDGNFYDHPTEGARICAETLSKLRAPNSLVKETSKLVKYHMYDFDCKTKESKLRRFFVSHSADFLEKLMLLKQADFSGCMDDKSTAPTVASWKGILAKMDEEGAPRTLKQLAVRGNELITCGVPAPLVSSVLAELLAQSAVQPSLNRKEKLLKLALNIASRLGGNL